MKAKKANKVYRITEDSKKRYMNEGYDIYDDEGNLIEHSPLKKISYAEHEKEIAALKEKIAELETKKSSKKEGA